jgi:hypothetical protein
MSTQATDEALAAERAAETAEDIQQDAALKKAQNDLASAQADDIADKARIAELEKQVADLQKPPPAPTGKVLFGVNPGGYSTVSKAETVAEAWNRIQTAYGKIVSTRWWVSSFGWNWSQVPARFGKCGLYFNLGADVAGVNSGKYDAAWANLCKTAPTDRWLAASFSHEPEDEVAGGQFTIAQWQNAQKRLARIKSENTDHITFAPLLMGVSFHPTRYSWAANGNQPWSTWFDFDLTNVDALGIDIYQQGKDDASADTPQTIGGPFISACKAKGKKGVVGELGARRVNPPSSPGISDGARATFLTNFGKFANNNADIIEAVHYFESDNGRDIMVPWALTPNPQTGEFKSPQALAAYKALIV